MIRHAHVTFAPLDFINEKITGKCGKPNIPLSIKCSFYLEFLNVEPSLQTFGVLAALDQAVNVMISSNQSTAFPNRKPILLDIKVLTVNSRTGTRI